MKLSVDDLFGQSGTVDLESDPPSGSPPASLKALDHAVDDILCVLTCFPPQSEQEALDQLMQCCRDMDRLDLFVPAADKARALGLVPAEQSAWFLPHPERKLGVDAEDNMDALEDAERERCAVQASLHCWGQLPIGCRSGLEEIVAEFAILFGVPERAHKRVFAKVQELLK